MIRLRRSERCLLRWSLEERLLMVRHREKHEHKYEWDSTVHAQSHMSSAWKHVSVCGTYGVTYIELGLVIWVSDLADGIDSFLFNHIYSHSGAKSHHVYIWDSPEFVLPLLFTLHTAAFLQVPPIYYCRGSWNVLLISKRGPSVYCPHYSYVSHRMSLLSPQSSKGSHSPPVLERSHKIR